MGSNHLSIDNLECVYLKSVVAVSGVSLHLKEGQIVAVLGPNGAGKTTTLRSVMGKSLLKSLGGEIRKGEVHFKGERVDMLPTAQVVRMGISMVAEGRGIFGDMTVEENLKVGAHSVPRGQDVSARYERVYSFFPQLAARSKRLAGYLSGGEQQMLAMGRALMTTPTILLLDEPSLGLAPRMVDEIGRVILEIRNAGGVSVILVEQNAWAALDIADYAYVVENGSIVLDGVPQKLKEDTRVREFYLGISNTGERRHFRELKSYRKRKHWFS
jgi:branched-chain amino acid transport system ATP-binding protein